ncbi:MAG: glycosyltransferase [Deltaproteobacteria bacterium]|nr:glycosyltransferase [Deltaproteobacteria bacterium]
MTSLNCISRKHILVVARWPLGGIRTYMRYVFRHFPLHYHLTLLASSTHEDAALIKDVEEYNARLVIVKGDDTKGLVTAVFRELRTNKYDVILSQGFISAAAVFIPNLFFRVPHILTIHGIAEPKYFTGRFGRMKRGFISKVLDGTTVLYAVSNDILLHLYEQFPNLQIKGPPAVVIPNGIELCELEQNPAAPLDIREMFKLDDVTILFGFFGRFMQQKGFDLVIDAVDMLRQQGNMQPFAVVAVGSGDYLSTYQKKIRELDLEQYFFFLPFQSQVHHLYPQMTAIVMPSRWEASGLLAMEVLCMGRPLIASECIGLRETTRDTPAKAFPSENVLALADIMSDCMDNKHLEGFQLFAPQARARFDVANSTEKLVNLIDNLH